MLNFSLPRSIFTNLYSFAAVRGSSYRRTLFRKRKECNEIFEPDISITETRRALFLTSARKATQDLRQKLEEKQRDRRSLNDLDPLDVKACRLNSIPDLQFIFIINYGSVLWVAIRLNQNKTIKMLKYLFECINCGAICHFPLDSDQLLKAKTRNIEQKLREEKIPLCFESERSIILRHNWKKLRAQYRELQIGPSRFGSVRFHSGWARFLPLRFFLLKMKLATIFLQEDRFVPQRSAKKCIEIYTVLAHNLLFN